MTNVKNSNTNNIYRRIKKAASARKISLPELSKRVGFKSENAIYRYNQGVTPPPSTLKSIASTLDVSVDYLTGKTDKMPKDTLKPRVKVLSRKMNNLSDSDLDLISKMLDRMEAEDDNDD